MPKEHFPYVSIVAVVAVVAVVVLLLSLRTTTQAPAVEVAEEGAAAALAGEAVKIKGAGIRPPPAGCTVIPAGKCDDSGKLLTFTPKDSKKFQTLPKKDCGPGGKVLTYSCSGKNVQRCETSCAEGQLCQGGACVAQPPPAPEFCYYLKMDGTQWPAGNTYNSVTHEVTEGSGTEKNWHKGIVTDQGTFYNECVDNGEGVGSWTDSSTKSWHCGTASPYTSGEGITEYGIWTPQYCSKEFYLFSEDFDYGSKKHAPVPTPFGCSPNTGSCCFLTSKNAVDPESSCDGNTVKRKWYSSCGGDPKETVINCDGVKSTYSGREMPCTTENNYWGYPISACAEPACTPGEVAIRCQGSGGIEELSFKPGEYLCGSNGKWSYKGAFTSCPEGQTCKISGGFGFKFCG